MRRVVLFIVAAVAMQVAAKVKVTELNPSPEVTVSELQELPEGCSEETAFGLVLEYQGYVFEASLYPLHNKKWIVLSKWCLDEDETIYIEDENGNEIQAKTQYKDPFEGMKYPVIKTDSVSFGTRNYGGKEIRMFSESEGKRVNDKLREECSLDVLDADPKTRRVFCRSNPNDWCWQEQPYHSVIGWVDEEWICSNLLTTCP